VETKVFNRGACFGVEWRVLCFLFFSVTFCEKSVIGAWDWVFAGGTIMMSEGRTDGRAEGRAEGQGGWPD